MPRLPPLNPLRAFEAAARHLSVTTAAAELHVTHSAVSHQIRVLEAALKTQLFRRSGARMVLSPEGAALLPAITGAFDRIAAATQALSRPATAGRLAVCCAPGLLSLWLLPSIGNFCATYPEVQLKLITWNGAHDLGRPDVDVFICYGDGDWPRFDVRLLASVRLFPICHPSLLHDKSLRVPADIFRHVILHADDGREWKNWLLANNVQLQTHHRQHFMADARVALEAAACGYGIALGDSVTSRKALTSGQMVAPFESEVSGSHSYYIVKDDKPYSQVAKEFINWIDPQFG